MITTFSALLRALQVKEQAELARQDITHAPTIGAMYEGLTKELLDRSIPESAGLKIVDGFVVDNAGNLSPQIDCMLVRGEGERIPYTESYKWHVKDVVAVFEVKKNLYGTDLRDSYEKLRAVSEAYWTFVEGGGVDDTDITLAVKSFANLTGFYPPSRESVPDLGEALEMMYHQLVMEQLSPIRVIFGYDGYIDEYALRVGFSKYMEQHVGQRGFGVASLPQLVVCGQNSIIKLNGQPYSARMNGDWWPVLASNAENPLRLLLELIWTRLSVLIGMEMPPDDSLQLETLHLLLSARFERQADKAGWHFDYAAFSRDRLQSESAPYLWEPIFIGQNEFILLSLLAKRGTIKLDDPDLLEWKVAENVDLGSIIGRLVEARFIARSGTGIRLINPQVVTGFLPDGRTFAGWQSDRLLLWTQAQIEEIKRLSKDFLRTV